jgi:hypothetical protein
MTVGTTQGQRRQMPELKKILFYIIFMDYIDWYGLAKRGGSGPRASRAFEWHSLWTARRVQGSAF